MPSRSAQLDNEPGGIGVRLLVRAIGAAAVAESAVPSVVPRVFRRVTAS